jgi:cysteine desulfurase
LRDDFTDAARTGPYPVTLAKRIYADANATAPPLAEVVDAVTHALRSITGNPASAHAAGAHARRAVERAREQVASLVEGCFPEDLFFVSGGTEANNTVLRHFDERGAVFFASRAEHASVLRPLERADAEGRVVWLRLDPAGQIDPGSMTAGRHAPRGTRNVLAIQAANSETGVLQPVGRLVEAFRQTFENPYVLLDAAQAVGRIPLSSTELGVDAITFSGHKLHGPQGTGALILLNSDEAVSPLLRGGGQEHGLRSGTLNVPGIVGFGVAAEIRRNTMSRAMADLREIRDAFEARLREQLANRVAFNGSAAPRVPNTSNVQFADIDGMRLLALLDERGVMASQGSACSSGRPEPSAALTAMGLSAREAFASLRFSFSVLNDIQQAQTAADIVAVLVLGIAG